MQNDRSSSQFSLDSIIIPMYIHTKKKMIITRKETRDQDRGEGRDERKTSGEKQGGEAWNRIGRTSKLFRISFNDDDSLFFFFFQNICFQFQESSRHSTPRLFECPLISRVVTLERKKKNGKKKEDKKERREEEWRGGGRKRGRKAKETAGGREERHNGANEKEEGGEKGWGSERKIDGGARCIRAFHFPCLSFPPLRQPDKGPSGTRSQVFTGPIRDERCQMENSRE